MEKLTPCFLFNGQAGEAAKFYTSVFKKSKILKTIYYGEAGPGPAGSIILVTFRLFGQEFIALNGPRFPFTEAISFSIECDNQRQVDYYWKKLSEGGQPGPCGWLKDKFGVSWQVVPRVMVKMLADKDRKKVGRVMEVMMKMSKIETKPLLEAYKGK
jgi:predicted 3-demethylubiquinone-9 3-methyltransferase (glyoxalase superfamily)